MFNDLKRSYEFYYIRHADGRDEAVNREKCFVAAEAPTAENPFTQRWFAVPDGKDRGYIIRLPRSAESERLYRQNEAMRQAEKRLAAEDYACLAKTAEGYCDKDCRNCDKRVTRTVPLNKPVEREDESTLEIDLPSDDPPIDAVLEQKETVEFVLARLPEGYERIVRLRYLEGFSATEIAEELGCSRQYINKALRKSKLLLEKLLGEFLK